MKKVSEVKPYRVLSAEEYNRKVVHDREFKHNKITTPILTGICVVSVIIVAIGFMLGVEFFNQLME